MLPKAAIYLDANAGAPLRTSVVQEIEQLIASGRETGGGCVPNPSSVHAYGRRAKRWMAEARERISLSIACAASGNANHDELPDPEQLVLTSSGTEANQLAIRSALEPSLERGASHWITTPIEHDSVLQLVPWFEGRGGHVSYLPVDAEGRVALSALPSLLKPETALLSIAWVNNETGVITDVAAAAVEARAKGVPLHVDAAQAWGKVPIDADELGATFVTFSAHKIGALAGTGVLWVSKGSRVLPLIRGKQDRGRRGGTENVLGAVAAGRAASELDPIAWSARVAPLRDRLKSTINSRIPGARVNGGGAPRVANTLNLSFDGIEGDGLVPALDLAGYSVSSGSACSSGALEPSHVLLAMGRSRAQATAALRISLSDAIEWSELEGFVEALSRVVERMRKTKVTNTKTATCEHHNDLQQTNP